MRKLILLGSLLFCMLAVNAQTPLYMPRNFEKAYQNQTRSYSGAPGPKYWQNSATYDIQVNFDPATNLVSGKETIVYTNNSPDNIYMLNFKIFPNLYQKGNIRNMAVSPEDITDGVKITNININDSINPPNPDRIAGTNYFVGVPELKTGNNVKISMSFSYTLNKGSHIRTGSVDSSSWFIAYFFPRIAVYDDINGWDINSYRGITEFYNDFCNFRVSITVPGTFQVWATGDLMNGKDIYTDKIQQRINLAEKQDAIIDIIDSLSLKDKSIVQKQPSHTWIFEAKNVTDFAFALSDHYLWKSTSVEVDPVTKRRTRVDAVFNPSHADYYEVIKYARGTVYNMSYFFPKWPFPYSHETVFDGLDQMEYPMMANDNPLANRAEAIELSVHEIFHTMFPFYMGINETLYAWMDEGWASIGEWLITPKIDSSIIDNYGINTYSAFAGNYTDLPIITPSTQLTESVYATNSYGKTALGYFYVRDMLGDSLFEKALHLYISRWHGKHPEPYDFFYSMNEGAGRNMNWFWKSWFFDSGFPDLAIGKVSQNNKSGSVEVISKGNKPVPVDLTIEFANGSTIKVHKAIDCWEKGNKTVTVTFPATQKIMKVVLGNNRTADVDPSNNEYVVK
ncbi:peptidase [Chitinophaga silvatica]|uniref:Peptidase n=1 Tax=Chitinophaga silvatica TaxID=2282649 RepID=A0A3E1Y2I0_9BACT|nr:M1 family metallopeptidase [Chitinophaga silvatica]RFS18888.1 peptidase [Chitinophaga silvatica]